MNVPLHSCITEHPTYRDAVEEAARVKKRNADYQLAKMRERAEYEQAVHRHKAAVMRALENGGDLPAAPTAPPDLDPLGQELAQSAVVAQDIVTDALRQIAPEVLPELARLAAELEVTVGEVARTLAPLVRAAEALRGSAERLRSVQGEIGVRSEPVTLARLLAGERVLPTTRTVPAPVATPAQDAPDSAEFDPNAPRGNHSVPAHLGGGR